MQRDKGARGGNGELWAVKRQGDMRETSQSEGDRETERSRFRAKQKQIYEGPLAGRRRLSAKQLHMQKWNAGHHSMMQSFREEDRLCLDGNMACFKGTGNKKLIEVASIRGSLQAVSAVH